MCQISVVVEKDGVEEMVMEDVTNLVVGSDNLEISNLFEGPKLINQVVIRSIDFVAGKVLLQKTG
ncbi:MAG: CooT family nickel-binding protein [Desulfofustis sp.]|nr:CooT family nickel-binding protein [Desulfofustis sp.]